MDKKEEREDNLIVAKNTWLCRNCLYLSMILALLYNTETVISYISDVYLK